MVNRQLNEDEWDIEGQRLAMPVQIRDASLAAAVFTCPVSAAHDVLSDTPFTPLAAFGRTFSLLMTIKYIDGDLGTYDEFGIAVPVRGPGRVIGLYTAALPVTATFTRAAGRTIWGMPKFLTQGSIVTERRQSRFDISDGNDFVMSGAIAANVAVPGRFSVAAGGWSLGLEGANHGAILRFSSRIRAAGIRVRPGGSRLALGQHPMAQTARLLGMAETPKFSMTAEHITLALAAPTVTGPCANDLRMASPRLPPPV